MFDVGSGELLLIFIIGLLVLGPQRLPKVAAEIGKWVGRARRTATELRRQLEREIELNDIQPPPPGNQTPQPPAQDNPPPPATADAPVSTDSVAPPPPATADAPVSTDSVAPPPAADAAAANPGVPPATPPTAPAPETPHAPEPTDRPPHA